MLDRLVVYGSVTPLTVDGRPGADQNVIVSIDGTAGDDGEYRERDSVGADVEGVFGGRGSDALTGNAADGFPSGGVGNDYLTDRGGRDILSGGSEWDDIDAADGAQDVVQRGTRDDKAYRARHGRFRIALTLTDAAGNARHVSVRIRL